MELYENEENTTKTTMEMNREMRKETNMKISIGEKENVEERQAEEARKLTKLEAFGKGTYNERYNLKEAYRVIVQPGPELMRYLQTGAYPEGLNRQERKVFAYKARPYTLIEEILYRKGNDKILRRVVPLEERDNLIKGTHEGFGGGHFGLEISARKILQQGLWWDTLYKDVLEYVKTYNVCQRTGPTLDQMEFNPIIAPNIFQKWGLDFIGPIYPAARYTQNQYILAAREYTTKWVEAIATKENNARVTAKFLYQNTITRYGLPEELASDQGSHFMNLMIQKMTSNYKINHRFSTPYYPQCNGQAESTNKVLLNILRKEVSNNQYDWDTQLPAVVWAFRTTYKVTTGHTISANVWGGSSDAIRVGVT